jgi:hypothetical protein
MMKKFDANGDGQLDDAEKAKLREAIGTRRGGEGRPGGKGRPEGRRPGGKRPDGDKKRPGDSK